MNIRECKHCKKEFDIEDKPIGWMANHSRWCDENPKRKEYIKTFQKSNGSFAAIVAMNKAKKVSGNTNQHTAGTFKGHTEETIQKWKKSSTGKKHSDEAKNKIRERALASPHRRLKKRVVEYKGILLDSSWELELAKRLDELNIKWIRPNPIPWKDDEGTVHNYFPDFYLPEYDKYLDPKNKHAIKVQEKKLKILLTQYENIDIIDSLEGCKTFSI